MDVIRDGMLMAVYVFALVVLYIIISGVFDDTVTSFEDLDMANSDAEVEASARNIRTVFDISFAGLLIGPCIWFIFRTFMREPDWRY